LEVLAMLRYLISIVLAVQTPPRRPRLNRPVRREVRPLVERLEDRTAPAGLDLLWVAQQGNTAWLDKSNWINTATGTNVEPGANDNLIFDPSRTAGGKQGSNLDPDATTKSPAGVANLTVATAYTGKVTFTQAINITGTLKVQGGTLQQEGGFKETLTSATGGLQWSGGTISLTGLTLGSATARPTSTISGPVVDYGSVIDNYGTINWTGGDITLKSVGIYGTSALTIESGGAFNMQSDNSFIAPPQVFNPAPPLNITNYGTIEKSAGAGTSAIPASFANMGHFFLHSGTVALTGSGTNVNLSQDGAKSLTELDGGSLTLASTYTINGGTLDGVGTITGSINNAAGTVHPGLPGGGGRLNIVNGQYQQGAEGTLAVDVTDKGIGLLNVQGGLATPGGTIWVTRNTDYRPTAGTQLTFLQAGTIGGPGWNAPRAEKIDNNAWNAGGVTGLSFNLGLTKTQGRLTVVPPAPPKPGMGALTPNSGAIGGGTAVVLTGQGFTGATAVSFGGTPAASFSVLSDTEIIAVASAAANAGPVDVTVTTSAGTSATTSADLFTYTSNLTNTTTALSSSASTTSYGQSLTLTATVTPGGSGTPTGSVNFMDGTTVIGTAPLGASGVATLTLNSLAPGAHVLEGVYSGDTSFAGSASPSAIGQTVTTANTTTTLTTSATPALAGTPVTLTAAVAATTSGTPTGTVEFVQVDPNTGADLAFLGAGTLDASGQATLTLSTLPLGASGIQATYLGDGNFNSSSGTVNQVITATPTVQAMMPSAGATAGGNAVLLFGQAFTTATAVSFGGIPATSFSVLSDSEILAVAPAGSAGSVDVTVTNSAGTSATKPDDLFTYANSLTNTTTTLSSSAGSTVPYGQTLTLTATVSPGGSGTPTGTVTFLDGSSVLGTAAPDASGVATLTLTNLDAGEHLLTAVYSGDNTFAGSVTTAITQTVTTLDTTTTLTSSASPALAGTPVTLTVAVASTTSGTATGTVEFWQTDSTGEDVSLLGSAVLDGTGQATLALSTLPAGSDVIQAVYLGDGNFNSSSNTLTEVITVVPAVGSVMPSTGASTGGSSVLVVGQGFTTATAVAFGSTPASSFAVLSDSEILAVAPAEPAGPVDVTVTGSGGTSATTPADLFSYSSVLNNTTTSLSSSAGTTTYGQALTLTATVSTGGSGTATGSVTFLDGNGTVLGSSSLNSSGIATLTVTNLTPGQDQVTASYGGDVNFAGSAATPIDQTVATADTTLTLTSSANPVTVGSPVTFTAAVASTMSGTPTGTVLFWQVDPTTGNDLALLGTATLDLTGRATLTLSTLPAGSDVVQAVYLGDNDFNPNSAEMTEVVNKAQPMVMLTSSANPATAGQPVTFTASVTGPAGVTPTGTVTFYDGTTALGTVSLNSMGMASLTLTTLGVGSHSITAVYSGDAPYAAASSSALQEVIDGQPSMTGLTSSQNPAPAGSPVTFTATVSGMSGTPTGQVQFWVLDPRTLMPLTLLGTGTLNGSGQASLTVSSLASGSYFIEAIYLGDSTFNNSSGMLDQVIS
jgi:hypothetical protein